MSHKLWGDWKSDSDNRGGQLLRLATAQEFGARYRPWEEKSPEERMKFEPAKFSEGEIAGACAYVRATWEASQYVLEKARVEQLVVYRGEMRGSYQMQRPDGTIFEASIGSFSLTLPYSLN